MGFLDELNAATGGGSGVLTGNFSGIFSTIFGGLQLLLALGFALAVIWYLFNREKYNHTGEIWTIVEGSIIPSMESKIRGGYFVEDGKREFRLSGSRFKDAVVNINPKHIVKDGKLKRFWLRKEGDRYYYSFIPRTWLNKEGKTDFVLEVENSSIVNQAINKDEQIIKRHLEQKSWEKYLPMLVQMAGYLVIIIMLYYAHKTVMAGMAESRAMRAACTVAKNTGEQAWMFIPMMPTMFKSKWKKLNLLKNNRKQ